MYRGCNKQGRVFLTFLTFQLSTMWKWTSTDLEVLVHFHIVERGSLENLENIPNFPNFFRGLKRPDSTLCVCVFIKLRMIQPEYAHGDRGILFSLFS